MNYNERREKGMELENQNKKPPLGLKPQYIWILERMVEIRAALLRFWADDLHQDSEYVAEWMEEYLQLKKDLITLENKKNSKL